MRLVTIYNSFFPAEAEVVRSRLEAANIPATVTHELSALSMEGYSLGVGGIKVQVLEDRVEEAKQLLQAGGPRET
jgi:hypothetical protein